MNKWIYNQLQESNNMMIIIAMEAMKNMNKEENTQMMMKTYTLEEKDLSF